MFSICTSKFVKNAYSGRINPREWDEVNNTLEAFNHLRTSWTTITEHSQIVVVYNVNAVTFIWMSTFQLYQRECDAVWLLFTRKFCCILMCYAKYFPLHSTDWSTVSKYDVSGPFKHKPEIFNPMPISYLNNILSTFILFLKISQICWSIK